MALGETSSVYRNPFSISSDVNISRQVAPPLSVVNVFDAYQVCLLCAPWQVQYQGLSKSSLAAHAESLASKTSGIDTPGRFPAWRQLFWLPLQLHYAPCSKNKELALQGANFCGAKFLLEPTKLTREAKTLSTELSPVPVYPFSFPFEDRFFCLTRPNDILTELEWRSQRINVIAPTSRQDGSKIVEWYDKVETFSPY